MNESITAQRLRGKNVVIIGGSRGLGRDIVAAAQAEGARVLAIARQEQPLRQLAAAFPGVRVLTLDAASEGAPAKVFEALLPDILIVCAGAIPHMAPLVEQSWEQFSTNWNSDVKMSLLFSQAALTAPLPVGATILLMSSGAALGGSPLSGGYAGAKRTQIFLADYAQKESARLQRGLRFLALVPGRIISETELGKVAARAYASSLGLSPADFIETRPARPTPEDVANAVVALVSDPSERAGKTFVLSASGIELLP
ncbi:short-chain dehydrogenase [Dictyobacter sp. S3.2.2.5]|uniref:Short-chain dehydrogenase n=1 Tax=Dictyobacter halimunensis TaxID=3026934 RepID=A0ABQ6FMK3_9CHLR|nr:short-chain dehydrogenase [Dictyobacter sp. S3.2.2.5]